jgi:phage gp36-like protein
MSYAPLITRTNLENLINAEVIDEITRGDGTKITTAIDSAIQEAKMYLTRYDIIRLFGDKPDNGGLDVPPSFTDAFLNDICTSIACWRLVKLCNANILFESMKLFYDEALDSLKRIQKGLADPKWPYQDNTGEADHTPASDQVTIKSNPLRETDY